jgi:hypothetical protein
MSILSKLFGGGGGSSNPANAAMPYLNQIPQVGHNAYDPYISQGRGADARLGGEYESMMGDPTAFINKLMEGYEPSKGYQFQKGQLTNDMSNTAAAGGVAGTPLDQMNQAEGIQGLLSKDMQQYLTNALGIHTQGMEGEQGFSNRGYNASGSLADILGGSLNQQGGLAFQGQQQQNADRTAMIGALMKALGLGAGAYFNPAGTAVGLLGGS